MLEAVAAGLGTFLGMTNPWLTIPGTLVLSIGVALWYKSKAKEKS